MAGMFLGEGGNRQDPLANPLHADLKGFPPMYIQTGADETLLDDSRKLTDLARKSGVDVTLEIVPEMQHVFQFLAGTAPEGDAAIHRLADWVPPKLGPRKKLLCAAISEGVRLLASACDVVRGSWRQYRVQDGAGASRGGMATALF
jgi:hypothetical protein